LNGSFSASGSLAKRREEKRREEKRREEKRRERETRTRLFSWKRRAEEEEEEEEEWEEKGQQVSSGVPFSESFFGDASKHQNLFF
jgi:hypothetical protein